MYVRLPGPAPRAAALSGDAVSWLSGLCGWPAGRLSRWLGPHIYTQGERTRGTDIYTGRERGDEAVTVAAVLVSWV